MNLYEESILTLSMLINSKGELWNEQDRKSFFSMARDYMVTHPEEPAVERVSNGMNVWIAFNDDHPISQAYFEIPVPENYRSTEEKELLTGEDAFELLDSLEAMAIKQFNSHAS